MFFLKNLIFEESDNTKRVKLKFCLYNIRLSPGAVNPRMYLYMAVYSKYPSDILKSDKKVAVSVWNWLVGLVFET